MSFDYWQKFEAGKIYHIYNRGINGVNIFQSDDNYIYFLSKWKHYFDQYLDTLAFCLMPNHFHFLIYVKEADANFLAKAFTEKTRNSIRFVNHEIDQNAFLEDQAKRFFTCYALAFNKQQKRTGSLFQKRFKRVSINNDVKLIDKICYVHFNPVLHGFTRSPEDWKYSSYRELAGKPKSFGITHSRIYSFFDEKDLSRAKKEFIRCHNEYREFNIGDSFFERR